MNLLKQVVNNGHLRSFGWYYVWVAMLAAWMLYANSSGWRLFTFGRSQPWTAQGAGYHK